MSPPMLSAALIIFISSLAVDLHSPTAHGRRVRAARDGRDAAPTGRSAAPTQATRARQQEESKEEELPPNAVAIAIAPSLEGDGDIEMQSFADELAKQGVLHASDANSNHSISESARVSRLSKGEETATAVKRRAGKFTRRFSSTSMALFGNAVDQMKRHRKQNGEDDRNETHAPETAKTGEEHAIIVQMMDGTNITKETQRFEYLALQTEEHRNRTAGDLMMGLGTLVFVHGSEEPLDPAFLLDNVFPRASTAPAAAEQRERPDAPAIVNPLQQTTDSFSVATRQSSDTATSKRVLFAVQDQRIADAITAFTENGGVASIKSRDDMALAVARILAERIAASNREESGVVIDKFYEWQFRNAYTPTLADRYIVVRKCENCTHTVMARTKHCCKSAKNTLIPSLEFCQTVVAPGTVVVMLGFFFLAPVLMMISHAQPCVSEEDYTVKLGAYSCWAERGNLWEKGYRPAIFSRDQIANLIFTLLFGATWGGSFFCTADCTGCFGFCGIVAFSLKIAIGPGSGVMKYYNKVFDDAGVFTLQSQLDALNATHFASTNTSLPMPEGLAWMGATEADFKSAKLMAILDITFSTLLFVVMLLFSGGDRNR